MTSTGEDVIVSRLREAGISEVSVSIRQFETERIYLVTVPAAQVSLATGLGSLLESELATESDSVVVSIRPAKEKVPVPKGAVSNLQDPRVDALVQLLTSRSRTSEAQPSLSYIPNNTANVARVTGARHHLVFGRRGAGKTALLLEAKRLVETSGHMTTWVNMQPLRNLGIEGTYVHVLSRIFGDLISQVNMRGQTESQFYQELHSVRDQLLELINSDRVSPRHARRLVPIFQQVIRRAVASMGSPVYLFLDDFYFMPRGTQADILDLLHSSIRDADVWLKIASIRHLTRWFRPSPPIGLQTGQDAELIDLDLSLQDPSAATNFLTKVLGEYCIHAGISNPHQVITREAIDRLVFGSGGVPRDFLTLAAAAISKDRSRPGARAVGISAINEAAGEAAKDKLGELEDDLISNSGYSEQAYQALSRVRNFCLDEKSFTYFRVDFRDKERNSDEYAVLTRLLEVRLIHLIDASVSYADRAGERSECYTLDLSQYSGSRLKQGLRVLDIQEGVLASRQTRSRAKSSDGKVAESAAVVTGKTARQVVGILRKAPLLELSSLGRFVHTYEPILEAVEEALSGRRSRTLDELIDATGRPYEEVTTAISDLLERGRVKAFVENGVQAYKRRA